MKNSMNTNNKLNKANTYRLSQEVLRNKALKNGVNLIAPETIFLSITKPPPTPDPKIIPNTIL